MKNGVSISNPAETASDTSVPLPEEVDALVELLVLLEAVGVEEQRAAGLEEHLLLGARSRGVDTQQEPGPCSVEHPHPAVRGAEQRRQVAGAGPAQQGRAVGAVGSFLIVSGA